MKPIHADFAVISGYLVDKKGNVWYKGTTRNFAPLMAMAAERLIEPAFRKAMDAKEKAEAEKEKGDEDAEAEDKEGASDSAENSHLKVDSPAKEAGLGDLEKPKE